MHKYMNKFGFTGIAATILLAPAIALAQDEAATDMPPEAAAEVDAPTAQLTPDQEAAMQSWPTDQQAGFKLWPADTQAYFWSLAQERQEMFWALSDTDKVALSQMPEPQRESVWAQIETRAAPPQG